MSHEETQGYIVMENVLTEPMQPKIIKSVTEPDMFYVTFEACLQSFDCLNRNRRNYALAPMMEAFKADHIQELLRKGTWVGENGHPDSENIKRILTVDPTKICHRICNYELKGKLLYGTIETLNDDSYGKQFAKHILQGLHPSFSLRALASITKGGDGISYIKTKPHIITYDRVILPSHREAYMDASKPITVTKSTMESYIPTEEAFQPATGNTFNTQLHKIEESTIPEALEYIKAESKRVKELATFFNSSFEKVKLIDESTVLVDDGDQKLYITLEDYIRKDIEKCFTNLNNFLK